MDFIDDILGVAFCALVVGVFFGVLGGIITSRVDAHPKQELCEYQEQAKCIQTWINESEVRYRESK